MFEGRLRFALISFKDLAAIVLKLRTSCPECYHCGSGVLPTCVCMILQRNGCGTISTPPGGAVGNGAFLDSAKALNHKYGNKDEQDFGFV